MPEVRAPSNQFTGIQDLRFLQERVQEAFRALAKSFPFLSGEMAGPISIATADVVISHGLKRIPRGVIVCRCDGTVAAVAPIIFRAGDAQTVTVRQGAGGTAANFTLWIW